MSKLSRDMIRLTVRPDHKLPLTVSHKAQLRGDDDAIWDRVLPVPFDAKTTSPSSVSE